MLGANVEEFDTQALLFGYAAQNNRTTEVTYSAIYRRVLEPFSSPATLLWLISLEAYTFECETQAWLLAVVNVVDINSKSYSSALNVVKKSKVSDIERRLNMGIYDNIY
jgi:hypothetical protein